MAACTSCGTNLGDGAKFCPSCGTAAAAAAGETQEHSGSQDNEFRNKAKNAYAHFTGTPDSTAGFDQKDIADNKVMAVLAYFGFLVFVPIVAAKDSKFARFHANQGLILFITAVVYWVAYLIVTAVLTAISWRLGAAAGVILSLFWIIFSVFAIIGIVNAAQGKAKELPLVGRIRILK